MFIKTGVFLVPDCEATSLVQVSQQNIQGAPPTLNIANFWVTLSYNIEPFLTKGPYKSDDRGVGSACLTMQYVFLLM